MSSFKNPLNLDPNFQEWASATALNTNNWTYAGTNATELRLDRHHDRDHIERTRFSSRMKASDYIYSGRFSHRSVIDTALGSFTLTSNEFAFDANMIPAISLVYRCVAGLTLTMRVAAAPSIGGTDNASLNTDQTELIENQVPRHFFWDTTATRDLSLRTNANAVEEWRRIGIQGPPAPGSCRSLQVRIDVTDVTATLPAYFDIGEFAVTGQGSRIHGVG